MTKNINGNLFEVEEAEAIQSKKASILSLYNSGTKEIEAIAAISGAKPSYVGSVLQKEGLIDNYFDLYTSNAHPKNVYSKYFQGKLGFKDVFTARRSVENLENSYNHFADTQDRAGQHHALEMALTMLDRARWTGKLDEAEVYRRWLVNKLSAPLTRVADTKAQIKEVENAEEFTDEKVRLKRAA
ncbi:MAG TPA: hypothetical protein VNI84_06040 [Pyrinomonadaceae bacterium]|nr:hypothetical protein [Pyrinomonadaceae bacterium]